MKFTWRDSNGRLAFCFYEVLQTAVDKVTVVFTEVNGNTGLSITNDCEQLATRFYIEMLRRNEFRPNCVRFVEHYTDSPERWDEVAFGSVGTRTQFVKFSQPTWHRVTKPEGTPTHL